MAIRGKKKSGSRGSQARRRPAAAPRPVVAGARHKPPWYNTATGRVIAAILVVLALAAIGTAIAINRSNANEQKEKREDVSDYANQLAEYGRTAAPALAEMSTIAPGAPADQLETLAEDAEGWATDIEAAATQVTAATPPEDVVTIHPMYRQAFQLYATTARILMTAGEAEGKAQADLLTRATEVRSQGDALWGTATTQLDDVLGELGGDPSGLQPPTAVDPSMIPTAPTGGGGGGGQGGGGQGGGGNNGGQGGGG